MKEELFNDQNATKELAKLVYKHTISDYYTPNIKAEVILDMLLTDEISKMIDEKIDVPKGTCKLITKEMSIGYSNDENDTNRGKKVDYLVYGNDTFYLVELKTTWGSLGNDQKNIYSSVIEENMADYLLVKLCHILGKDARNNPLKTLDEYLNNKLTKDKTCRNKKIYHAVCSEKEYQEAKETYGKLTKLTREYQKMNQVEGTYKYIHTVADIIENSKNIDNWKKPMKLVYIYPKSEKDEILKKDDNIIDICLDQVPEDNKILYNIIKELFIKEG